LTAVERLGVALLIGLLIGLDRERSPKDARGSLFAGVRTFPLIALTGALPMILAPPLALVLLAAAFLGVSAIAGVAYLRTSSTGDVGSTTEIAALATFLLGTLAGAGELVVAAATGVAIAVLLHAKLHLERFSRALSRAEVAAILELAVISVIVLPLMPRQGYGPWQVLNPFEIWLVVVLVSMLSLIGFVAVRLVGESRGLAMTGFVGGLVSSTAITLSMAERSRAGAAAAGSLAAATVLASTIMCARIAVLCAVINAALLPRVGPVLLAMALIGLSTARWLARGDSGKAKGSRTLANPFSLRRAITFGLIYAVVRLVVRAAQEWLGSAGLFVAAFLSALADVDAPTIAFARGGEIDGSWRVPAAAIAIAAVSNTLVKLVLAWSLGAGEFRKRVAVALGAMALAGAAATAIVYARP
jgi:uncharacterized membrane protein (DUF4010 family)